MEFKVRSCPKTFLYTNWKGLKSQRKVAPIKVWFGSNEFHPEPQWFLQAVDLEKDVVRDFALKDIEDGNQVEDVAFPCTEQSEVPERRQGSDSHG